MKERGEILALFPAVSVVGGLEISGRIAIEVIQAFARDLGRPIHHLFYGKRSAFEDPSLEQVCTSPYQALSFVRSLKPVQHVFVWHLSLLRLAMFLRRKPATITVYLHGIEAWKKHSWLTRAFVRRVDLFLSNSDFTWTKFVEFCPEAARTAHRTVALGIDVPFSGIVPAPDAVAVLMIGRMLRSENYKGHREMIHAWPEVLRRVPEAELWIAGEGDLRPDLESLCTQLGVQHKVRFWGLVSEEEKQRLLMRCRCVALPSKGEGFGIVYLEAMRLGRPCLVSRFDAGQEVVTPPNAGLAADVSDSAELTNAVCELLASDTDTWAKWSENARCRYESKYTAAHFKERLASALEVISNHDSL